MDPTDSNQMSITTKINKEDIYPLNTSSEVKSICLIIFNWDFRGKGKLAGLKNDVKRISDTFQRLNFNVIVQENKTANDIRNILENIRKRLNQKQNCFVCFLLSRGFKVSTIIDSENGQIEVDGESGIIGIDGKGLLIIKELLELFNNQSCEQFALKPKLFFILGCRAFFELFDVDVYENDSSEQTCSDILVCYSLIKGTKPYLDSSGSLFSRVLTEELENCENKELTHILTKVSEVLRSNTPQVYTAIIKKQEISWEAIGWRKLFYFKLSQ